MPVRTRPNSIVAGKVALTTLAILGFVGFAASPRAEAQPAMVPSDAATATATQAAITKVLDAQTAAWNRGDLDTFLNGYWRSPRVVFFSGGTRNDGFDAMRDRYRKRYQSDGRAMGQLAFADLEIEPMGTDAAFVRGRYALTMPDGTHPSGLFTLIFRRFGDGWKITHDHTSATETAAPPPDPAISPASATPRPPG